MVVSIWQFMVAVAALYIMLCLIWRSKRGTVIAESHGTKFHVGDRVLIRPTSVFAGVIPPIQSGHPNGIDCEPGQLGWVARRGPNLCVFVRWDAQTWRESESRARVAVPSFECTINCDYLDVVAPSRPVVLSTAPIEPRRSQQREHSNADDVDAPQSALDTGDDPIKDILETCDKSPEAGLSLIEGMDGDLRKLRVVMFGEFIALRKLAFAKFFGSGASTIADKDASSLRRLFDQKHVIRAKEALQQIARIEFEHPGYIDRIDPTDDHFAVRMMDDVCTVMERLDPGIVQETLGWTKLRYFGTARIGSAPNFKASNDLLSKVMEVKFSAAKTARSAIAVYPGRAASGARGVTFFLCALNFRETPTIGDADQFGSVLLSEDSKFEFRPASD